ncbi:MAG TPA: squalene/phytoene synthase family protein [Candidatus Dormibacteraeota bacterium]|nr:squalene/phytoene synthase family protein [Candidatus Dormibacteraeota bacterium]
MSDYAELAAADAYCRLLAGRHYENFSVASRLLPAALRLDLARVYAYCRTTDDLGDESGAGAGERLARWRDEVEALFAGGLPVHPVLTALAQTVRRRGLPARPFLDLVAANVQDQRVHAYETWAELEAYCALSAAPVGRIVLRLFALRHPDAERLSDDVCVGLQLANFAQDVARDAARGRRYLLGPEVAELGVAGAVRAHCERARALLASGVELEGLVAGRLRLQLSLYRRGGLAIVDAIERAGFRTDRVRPRVSAATKLALVVRAVAAARGAPRVERAGAV